jgi:succinyl-CoA synthetase beta subunit
MKLYEYMGKEIFRREGIPVPAGRVCRSAREVEQPCRSLGPVGLCAGRCSSPRPRAG